ncbi:MAG: Prephenate dehydratase [Candidatus Lokiarchaeum sp. GC14_75]|nr:MAG: Prephenate dehydratase [Candidatus Lokiarchaeum sp. GC14_75]
MSEDGNYKDKIEESRIEINKIDDKLIDLINKRGKIAQKIGEFKKSLNMDIYQPLREKEIINRIKEKSTIFKPGSIEAIWREMMSASKQIQGFISKVGFLGPDGTFTHIAALEYFPKSGTEFKAFNNSKDIFENIEREEIDFGVVPIENSLHGTVRETLDLLIEKNLIINGEIEQRITQNLMSLETSNLSKIKTIISHPQAFAQTRKWINTNLSYVNLINANSTADAAQRVRDGEDESFAAIGPKISSKLYNLKILSTSIEDNPQNFTRFLIISKKENKQKEGKIKTSIVFVTKHTPGALYNALKIYAERKINLLKIESRPRRKGRWEYIFLMDFEGDKDDSQIKDVLEKLNENVIWYKILGSYPMVK